MERGRGMSRRWRIPEKISEKVSKSEMEREGSVCERERERETVCGICV